MEDEEDFIRDIIDYVMNGIKITQRQHWNSRETIGLKKAKSDFSGLKFDKELSQDDSLAIVRS